jgi:hypothetical protein
MDNDNFCLTLGSDNLSYAAAILPTMAQIVTHLVRCDGYTDILPSASGGALGLGRGVRDSAMGQDIVTTSSVREYQAIGPVFFPTMKRAQSSLCTRTGCGASLPSVSWSFRFPLSFPLLASFWAQQQSASNTNKLDSAYMSAHTTSALLIPIHPLQSTFTGVPQADDLFDPKLLWQRGLDEECTQEEFDALISKLTEDEKNVSLSYDGLLNHNRYKLTQQLRNTLLAVADVRSNQDPRQTTQQAANTCWGQIAMLSRATWDVIENNPDEKLIKSRSAMNSAYETYETELGGPDDLTNIDAVVKGIQALADAYSEAVTIAQRKPSTQYSSICSTNFIKPTDGLGIVASDKVKYQAGELGGFTSVDLLEKLEESEKPHWQQKSGGARKRALSGEAAISWTSRRL